MLNETTIRTLIEQSRSNHQVLDLIKSSIESFEQYHQAVFKNQMIQIIYGAGALELDESHTGRAPADKAQEIYLNEVITDIWILNQLAKLGGLPPVYDGVVSEEQPYRRQISNAVFAYIESIINNRS